MQILRTKSVIVMLYGSFWKFDSTKTETSEKSLFIPEGWLWNYEERCVWVCKWKHIVIETCFIEAKNSHCHVSMFPLNIKIRKLQIIGRKIIWFWCLKNDCLNYIWFFYEFVTSPNWYKYQNLILYSLCHQIFIIFHMVYFHVKVSPCGFARFICNL